MLVASPVGRGWRKRVRRGRLAGDRGRSHSKPRMVMGVAKSWGAPGAFAGDGFTFAGGIITGPRVGRGWMMSPVRGQVLVVEDDLEINELVGAYVQIAGYWVFN